MSQLGAQGPDDPTFAYVQLFTVAPGAQGSVVEMYRKAFTDFGRYQGGFVRSTVLQGQDGTTVVVLVEWRDRAASEQMFASSAFRSYVESKVRPVFRAAEAVHQAQIPCDVIAVYEPVTAQCSEG